MAKLAEVNTTDLAAAIRLGCQCMSSVFNADDPQGVAFFGSQVWPAPELSFSPYHSEAHVPGRHLNALLSAEHVLGLPLDERVVEQHAATAFFSFSGPVTLPLNRETVDGPLRLFMPHNVREGLHALYALARFRRSERALGLIAACVAAIDTAWDEQRGWDADYFAARGLRLFEIEAPLVTGLARALGPLVKIYAATSYAPALALALRLKDQLLREHFLPAGDYDPVRLGRHVHSVTCVLSSLAQLADLTNDAALLARVKTFYDNGLWQLRDAVGWSLENSRPAANPDFGEINNTGDLIETALILGRWGYTDYLADAERMLRGHLLPAQLRDISFIPEAENPAGSDGKRAVGPRHRGAFGFPAPYGHHPLGLPALGFNLDIVGGAVGSLCAAVQAVTRRTAAGHWVDLLFDHSDELLTVASPYTHPQLTVTVHEPTPLFVRLPAGVAAEGVTLGGTDAPVQLHNGYLFIPQPPVDVPLTIGFTLPERELVLQHRTRAIRARLRGEAVVAMEDFGAELTFFDEWEGSGVE